MPPTSMDPREIPRMRTRPLLTLSLTALFALGPLAGCAMRWPEGIRKGGIRARMVLEQRERTVPIQGDPITVGRFLGLDVENNAGGVFVNVAERHDEARVEFRVRHMKMLRQLADAEGWDPGVLSGPWFVAEHDHTAQTGVLRIRPSAVTLPDGSRPLLDLHIYTPVCDGVTITNRHGDVELIGVRGILDVESEGRIEVRTDEPLVEDIHLRSSGPGVLVVTAPRSAGTFLITAPEGRATFTSRYGNPERVTAERDRWVGVWNAGANRVTLHAEHGHARYMVKERAEMYTPGFN